MKWKAENTEITVDANKNVFIHAKQKYFKIYNRNKNKRSKTIDRIFFILRDSFKQPYGYNIKTWMKWILLIKVQIINTDVGKK